MPAARMRGAAPSACALFLAGCTLNPIGVAADDCPISRVTLDGACCAPWSRAEGFDCVSRSWSLWEDPVDEAAADPVVAVAPGGDVALAWVHVVSPAITAVMTAHERDGLVLRSPTAPLEGRVEDARIAVGTDGTTTVAWRRVSDGGTQIEASTMTLEGAWRANPEPLSFAPSANEPEVATGAGGEVVVAWNQWADDHLGVAVAQRRVGAPDFDRPGDAFDQLSPPVAFSNDPVIAMNPRGDGIICWFQSVGGTLATLVSERRGPSGAFEMATGADALSPLDTPVEDPVVALADDGQAVVAWRQELSDGKAAIFLAERDASGTWRAPSSLDSSFSEPVEQAWDVRVAMSAEGHAFVVWEEKRGADFVIVAAVRAPDGEWLVDGRAPTQLSTPGVSAIDPAVAVGRDGHVVAAWTELSSPAWRVVGARSTYSEGEAGAWTSPEVLSADDGGSASGVALAVGGDSDRVALAFVQGARLRLATVD